ncbi:TRAP transporter large permease [Leisingera sp. ANG-Vp]|uniref:TRAP transporter large permease n=1 Tax=Leisingera sp. ANG-Vp TaxID=1577896 RepID=UPI00057FFD26|nr:TRAP transporter large permease [Leisingera sp. ANG-Vp]KIC21496.1 C4-dicarboxylate ABC transporter permease [Leisingera sp. ANG-Vp]
MTPQFYGVSGIFILIVLVFLRVPIGAALLLIGVIGYAAVDGARTALLTLGEIPFNFAQAYSLSVVPLFLLMGIIAAKTTMAGDLFRAANAIFSGLRGGLAMATVGACAGFGAICGSSLATASTMTQVAVPEMRRHGYADSITSGVVASGGTLGILIPPSIILVIYAIIAQESVPKLFAAALLPGLMMAVLHIVVILFLGWRSKDDMPLVEAMPMAERVKALLGFWKMGLIFSVVVGGIYTGWFSPTEAAAVGALLTIVIGIASREVTFGLLKDSFGETLTSTGSLFFIILGAFMFAAFMVQSRIPATLGDWIIAQNLPPVAVILFFVLVYLVLGCFLDAISMILITVPVFLPIAETIGYSGIWFGVLLVIVAEIGLITPPVGMNLFVIRAQAPDITLPAIYKGILPFLMAHLASISLLILFPVIALWLPGLLY